MFLTLLLQATEHPVQHTQNTIFAFRKKEEEQGYKAGAGNEQKLLFSLQQMEMPFCWEKCVASYMLISFESLVLIESQCS